MKQPLLIVDDEETIRTLLSMHFQELGYPVTTAETARQGLQSLPREQPCIIICDIKMPVHDGFWLLNQVREATKPQSISPVIFITGHGEKDCAIDAVNKGAFGYLEKPFDMNAIDNFVEQAAMAMETEFRAWQSNEIYTRTNEPTQTRRFLPNEDILKKLAPELETPVLITGESGTGKEVWARALHQLAGYQPETFVAINCAAMPSDLLESELFGHEKGAFTGAHQTKVGLAELAVQGTLFLDEIGDMDIKLQAKILRLLQERTFRRVGGKQEIPFQGRFLAATHKNLPELVLQKQFREDLYYRLSVVQVTLPALRDRADRVDLALSLWASLCQRRRNNRTLTQQERDYIQNHSWPGNIRELSNCLERSLILGTPIVAQSPDLPPTSDNLRLTDKNLEDLIHLLERSQREQNWKNAREELHLAIDKWLIMAAIKYSNNNKSAAAEKLGIDRTTINRILKKSA